MSTVEKIKRISNNLITECLNFIITKVEFLNSNLRNFTEFDFIATIYHGRNRQFITAEIIISADVFMIYDR